ncbi:hypothetical protein H9P43_005437 [Blastocladiella emersonii ATCC 22665]|nr:hypothetical protein H9P43_005437 [Blastocladiella emersonii ATCC 22665]
MAAYESCTAPTTGDASVPQAPDPQRQTPPRVYSFTSDQLLDDYLELAITNLASNEQRELFPDAYMSMPCKKPSGVSEIEEHSTKTREVIKNYAAIVAALKSRHERFDAQGNAVSRGHKKLLLSLAYLMSGNTKEFPKTMAVLFLHAAAAGIFSQKFAPLLLHQAMRWLDLMSVTAGKQSKRCHERNGAAETLEQSRSKKLDDGRGFKSLA